MPLLAAGLVVGLAAGCGNNASPGLSRGTELYDTCRPCHGNNGGGNEVLAAPAIAGLPRWYIVEQLTKFKGSLRGVHPDDMEGHRMRPMALTLNHPGDVESVAEYVSKMSRVLPAHSLQGGDVAAGKEKYNSVCIACHGADGTGMEALKSPWLSGQYDWYLYSQLHKFQSGMRGAHPQDITGGQMRAMSMTLEDDAAVRNVVAYIRTLKVQGSP